MSIAWPVKGATTLTVSDWQNARNTFVEGVFYAYTDSGAGTDHTIGTNYITIGHNETSGIINTNAGSLLLKSAGTTVATLAASSATWAYKHLGVDGGASAPSYGFTSDTDTGIYLQSTGYVGVSSGGIQMCRFHSSGILMDSRIYIIDGLEATPSVAFIDDNNNGLYRIGADNFGVTVGGTKRWDFATTGTTTTLPIIHPAGSAAAPSLTFTGDTNTGVYAAAADTIGFSAGGTSRATISTTAFAFVVPATIPDGTASAPGIAFTSDTNTGLYSIAGDTLGVAAGGVLQITVGTAGATFAQQVTTRAVTTAAGTASLKIPAGTVMTTPEAGAIESDGTDLWWTNTGGTRKSLSSPSFPLQGGDGTKTAPTYSFSSDTDTGMYLSAAGYVAISSGDVKVLDFHSSGILPDVRYYNIDGLEATPSYAFVNDQDNGWYRIGADNLGLSIGGTKRWDYATTATTTTIPLYHAAGAVGTPSITFSGDTNTGFYSLAADEIGTAIGGALRMEVTGTEVRVGNVSAAATDGALGVILGTGTGTSQRGIVCEGTFASGATAYNAAFYADVTAPAANCLSMIGYNLTLRGSANTCTDFYGMTINLAATGAGAVTNGHGLYIFDLAKGTNKYPINQAGSAGTNIFGAGVNKFTGITTTASAANAYLDSGAGNSLLRSTSSLAYKQNVEDLLPNYADNVLSLRPVWYRSKAKADRADWSWFGLIAEEVALIEPRLVSYGYHPDDYEEVVETVQLSEKIGDTATVTKNVLKKGVQKKPDGVQYERLSVLLLDVVKRLSARVEALEAKA